ncbi:hypothetical protein HQN84_32890, partial [Pedobacter steynii]|uniref:condensation domain-containing protein n=1 Tax=Pedobacter steynii TaxID=430522 RepID=UPI0020B146CF
VPGHFLQLERLPLTSNGKVDRKSLPAVNTEDADVERAHIAPRNEIEAKLVLIWQEILGREKISVKAHFFELGGHSLKATRLSAKIHKTFDVRVAMKDVFIVPVLEDQAALIEQATGSSFLSIPAAATAESYVLSSSQRRLWVLSQFEDGNIAYNIPGVYVFEGALNIGALERSFLTLIERHEILRTVFKESEETEEVRQFILPFESVDFKIDYQDFRSVADRDEVVKGLVAAEFRHSFDLSSYPLLRAGLYQLTDHQWVFCYVVQHIISDGWSMGVLIRELLSLYNAFVTGAAMPLLPLRIQYKDYAAWQQSELTGDQLHIHQNYWMNQFSGQLPVLNLPLEKPRPAKRTYNGATISGTINADISEGLRSLIKEEGGTLFMGLVAAMNVLFYRYSGQEDIIIGSPIAGREHADLEDQIGFYINTLALRSRFKGSGDYLELLREVKKVTLDAYDHQVYPFDEVLEGLHLKRDMSRNPVFDVMIILQNVGSGNPDVIAKSFDIKGYGLNEHTISKYDLSFYFNEIGDELKLSIEYSTDLFSEAAVERLYGHFESLLAHVVKHPHHSLDDLIYIAEGERAPLFLDEGPLSGNLFQCSEHQKRLWFIDQFEKNYLYEESPVYHNLPLIVGLPESLDPEQLKVALDSVMKANEILRTRIVTRDGEPFQQVSEAVTVPLSVCEADESLDQQAWQAKCTALINQPFDIENDGLVRFSLSCNKGQHFLMITAHHLIADRASLRLLLNELMRCYRSEVKTGADPVPYSSFSSWQNKIGT